jgi:NAD(P)-dependent dehydrogenase (short-subunit alcohol dehydrogenase family)
MTNEINVMYSPPYAMSKATLNMLMAKFNAAYAEEGILFMSLCPGMVDTGASALEDSKCSQDGNTYTTCIAVADCVL